MVLIWKGRNSDAPTEIYLPPHIDPNQTVLISEKRIYNKSLPTSPNQEPNEAIFINDRNRETGSGNLVVLWDDPDQEEDLTSSYHYVLLVDAQGISPGNPMLQDLQTKLNNRILLERKSPIYFTGKMTYSGYPAE